MARGRARVSGVACAARQGRDRASNRNGARTMSDTEQERLDQEFRERLDQALRTQRREERERREQTKEQARAALAEIAAVLATHGYQVGDLWVTGRWDGEAHLTLTPP